ARLYGIYLNPRKYISSEKINSYYQSQKSNFQLPPRALVSEIFIEAPEQLRRNSQEVKQIKQTIDTIKRQYQAGTPFAELAQSYSEDTSTARRGGLGGWISRDKPGNPVYRKA
ncbi:MAG: peptidylprolyl isomerase, partial [bacterium]